MEKPPHEPLDLTIAQGLGLADQERHFLWQFAAFFDESGECVGGVVQMNVRLASADIPLDKNG
jgi:hypothetical protein